MVSRSCKDNFSWQYETGNVFIIKLSVLIRYGKYLSLYDQDFKHPKYFWPQVNPNPSSHQL